jgi:hypothetical protein
MIQDSSVATVSRSRTGMDNPEIVVLFASVNLRGTLTISRGHSNTYTNKTNKLRGFQCASKQNRPNDRRWLATLLPTFAVDGVAWSGQQIPTAINLGFLYLSRHLFNSGSSSIILMRYLYSG